jgi:hypothetical protein
MATIEAAGLADHIEKAMREDPEGYARSPIRKRSIATRLSA